MLLILLLHYKSEENIEPFAPLNLFDSFSYFADSYFTWSAHTIWHIAVRKTILNINSYLLTNKLQQ